MHTRVTVYSLFVCPCVSMNVSVVIARQNAQEVVRLFVCLSVCVCLTLAPTTMCDKLNLQGKSSLNLKGFNLQISPKRFTMFPS